MKKILITLFLLSTTTAFGASIDSYTEDTAPAGTDITFEIKNPSGTPLSRKLTWGNLFESLIGTYSKLQSIADDKTLVNTSDNFSMLGATDYGSAGILRFPGSTTLPGTCTVRDVYVDTDATSGLRAYLCESTNSWVAIGTATTQVTAASNITDTAVVVGSGGAKGVASSGCTVVAGVMTCTSFTSTGSTVTAVNNLGINFQSTGVNVKGASGVMTIAGIGNTNNENLLIDLESSANHATLSSSTGVNRFDLETNNIGLLIGTYGEVSGAAGQFSVYNTSAGGAGSGGIQDLVADPGTAMVNTNRIGIIAFDGAYDSSHSTGNGANVSAFAEGTWTSGSRPAKIVFQTVPSGSTTNTTRLTIDNAGSVTIANATGGAAATLCVDTTGKLGKVTAGTLTSPTCTTF